MIRRLIAAIAALQMMSVAAWAGVDCYAGAGAGKTISTADLSSVDGEASISLDGFQIGLRGGCDYLIPETPLIVGAFVGYDFVDASARIFDTKASADDYWTGGARVGFRIGESAMAYGLLGMATGGVELDGFTKSKSGTLYGAGLEIEMGNVAPGLVGYVEWQHIDWKQRNVQDGSVDPASDAIMVGARIKLSVLK